MNRFNTSFQFINSLFLLVRVPSLGRRSASELASSRGRTALSKGHFMQNLFIALIIHNILFSNWYYTKVYS